MKQKEQQVIVDYNDLQGWRTAEGEEQRYIKGFLMYVLHESIGEIIFKSMIAWVMWMIFLIFAGGVLALIAKFPNLAIEDGILKTVLLIVFTLVFAIVFGAVAFTFTFDKSKAECRSRLFAGNFEVLDVSIVEWLRGSGTGSVRVADLQGLETSRWCNCYYKEKHPITEGLLVKVERKNATIQEFWVIPKFVKNGQTYKYGRHYLRQYEMKRKNRRAALLKRVCKRALSVVVILYAVFVVASCVDDCIKFSNDGYTEVYATVTYVHNYRTSHTSPGTGGTWRANGYLEWEYDGITHMYNELYDLPSDAQEGDMIPIMVDSETGLLTRSSGAGFVILSCLLHVAGCFVVLVFLRGNPRKLNRSNYVKEDVKDKIIG